MLQCGCYDAMTPKERTKKLTFDLPLEKRDAFDFSQAPISVTEIAKRINDLTAEENMKKLTNTIVKDGV